MSPRKKNASKAGASKQPTINNFFSSKSKHASTSTRPKRLAQSSLAAKPLKRSPDPEILDLTQSTSPVKESESPPSAKKRKLKATSPDQSPIRGAQIDPFLSIPGRSTSPASHLSQKPAEPEPSNAVRPTPVSPAPSQTGCSQPLEFDPDEVVESSQTQYIHIRFTPSSQRILNVDPGYIPAPVFTPIPTRSRQQSLEPSSARKSPGPADAAEESQSTIFIPSSQGEISEPFTPKKRNRAEVDQLGAQTPSGAVRLDTQEPSTGSHLVGTPKHQRPTSTMPPPAHPALTNTPAKNRLVTANPFTPQFSSPRPISTPMYPSERSDQILSSEGDPSMPATELGTMESPPKLAKHPALPSIPESPAHKDTHTHQRATTPLLPISNVNLNPPQTPHRVVSNFPPSSPSDFPSPGRLMKSMGFQAPRDISSVPPPSLGSSALPGAGIERHTPSDAHSDHPDPSKGARGHHATEAGKFQAHGNEISIGSQSSSETIVPSSQPLHDSSPPPDYDLDPQRHSFNQSRLQSFSQPQIPDQPARAFDSRFPSNSSRPFFTAPTHQSSPPSSQSLPPSQSPIKGSRFDPNQSAAGIRGVFGMLGFGSEADDREAQAETHRNADDESRPHIPATFDLPPSSPPPQTPTRYESRESSPDSYLVPVSDRKGKAKQRVGKTSIHDSPLARAFEAAKKRSKTATPSTVRRPASKMSQIASSPIRTTYPDDMDVDWSPVQGSSSNSKRRTPKTGKAKAGLGVTQTPTRRAFQATQSKGSQSTKPTRSSVRRQRQQSVDLEIVESSDAEEMEIDVPLSSRFPTSTRATAGGNSSGEPTKPAPITPVRGRPSIRVSEELGGQEHLPTTPSQERLPSSVSPSPIRIQLSPARSLRHSSPPLPVSENTQTQDECETPWESLRPSQSVSQVYERQLIEEAERERRLRMEQNPEKAKVLVEETPDIENDEKDEEAEEADRIESQQQESLDQEPVRPVTISLNPRSPSDVPNGPPRLVLPHSFSTPKSQRIVEKQHYIVTPTKVIKRTPAGATPSRKSMTPLSTPGEDDPEEEYTYVEETFNPTESQQSFLNRILQGNSSQLG